MTLELHQPIYSNYLHTEIYRNFLTVLCDNITAPYSLLYYIASVAITCIIQENVVYVKQKGLFLLIPEKTPTGL